MGETKPRPAETQEARRQEQELRDRKLKERTARIKNTVVVLSGKGGVGKSTVAANLAVALSMKGFQVGLLDADMHGPSVPKILNLESEPVYADGENILPALAKHGLKVMSIGFLAGGPDEAVIWRGPLKMKVLRQLLADTEWGELDFLVVDLPPGTGDEPLSICQLIPDATGGILVTTPQDLSTADVRKCITFCRKLELPVLGVIENMSGFVCPHCGKAVDIFGEGGGQRMAQDMGVPFLGRLPIDPVIVRSCDDGRPFVQKFPDSPSTRAFLEAIEPVIRLGRQ